MAFNGKLTAKQEMFCLEYLIDLNATQAAIRAGYSKESAGTIGSENMQKPEVLAHIASLKAARASKLEITADYVLDGLKTVAERAMQREALMKWNYQDRQMEHVKDENGNDIWQFDSNGANKALELLGKHIGLFEADNRQKSQVINVKVDDDDNG